MALPKEPRQKMINLMYLVLTALLALNVSAEILNAFKTVDNSLSNANNTIDKKNGEKFNSFKELEKDPGKAERAKIWEDRALQAKKLADDTYSYIDGLKDEIKKAADYNPQTGAFKEDNLEAATRIMTSPGTKGAELLQKLGDFKTGILGINDSIKTQFANELPIDLSVPKSYNESSQKDWSSAYFNMTPTIAALTILRKFQNDVKNSEAMIVDYCHQQVGAVVYRVDQYAPIAALSSTYLMNGQELDVTAGVGAFNSQNQPSISIDGAAPELTGADGMVEKKITASGVGSHSVHITYNWKDQDGKAASYSHDFPYTVGEPTGLSISADDVKVLYIDLENHLTINSGNVGSEKVNVQSDNGSIKRGATPGVWIASPTKPGAANLNVIVDGKPSKFTFKVKSVPDPVGMVGLSKGGRMRVNEFKAQFGVAAVLENFVFEGVKFKVTGFTIVCTGSGFPVLKFADVQGDGFDPVRGTMIEQCKPGTTVTIDNIRASGPGGSRTLPPIVYNLY